MNKIYSKIYDLAEDYSSALRKKIDERIIEMQSDDTSHYLLYRVLGIADNEGKLIDEYQNKGRFLYKYAGSFLEDKFKNAQRKLKIPNTIGKKPKTFEIDCLVDNEAFEIKWRDATTDGDHITKEHTRVQNIKNAGFKPIRIMFYYPNRDQAIKIQETLKTIYLGVQGEYYFGSGAWEIVRKKTGVDLLAILEKIADERL